MSPSPEELTAELEQWGETILTGFADIPASSLRRLLAFAAGTIAHRYVAAEHGGDVLPRVSTIGKGPKAVFCLAYGLSDIDQARLHVTLASLIGSTIPTAHIGATPDQVSLLANTLPMRPDGAAG
jgi:hypothetical protein